MQETTDVRSPIRISLTAVRLILKYTVRELSHLDKRDVFFFFLKEYKGMEERKVI